MNIQERLTIFFQRLEAAPPAATAREALALVCRTIEDVEDEFCPLPRENPPPGLRFTGRMYAPQRDRIFPVGDGSLVAETRRHRIICQLDGGIQIADASDDTVVLIKDGQKR